MPRIRLCLSGSKFPPQRGDAYQRRVQPWKGLICNIDNPPHFRLGFGVFRWSLGEFNPFRVEPVYGTPSQGSPIPLCGTGLPWAK